MKGKCLGALQQWGQPFLFVIGMVGLMSLMEIGNILNLYIKQLLLGKIFYKIIVGRATNVLGLATTIFQFVLVLARMKEIVGRKGLSRL
jgi:hypothetical protein